MNADLSTISRLILFAVSAVLFSCPAVARESVAPPRIVIAPALSAAARAIKSELAVSHAARLQGAQDLYFFYGSRGFEPLWISEVEGRWVANDKALNLVSSFSSASELGLEPLDYVVPSSPLTTTEQAVVYELALTSTALSFAFHNYGGRLEPRQISSNLDMPRLRPAVLDLLQRLSQAGDAGAALKELSPQDLQFKALLNLLSKTADDDAPAAIPDGPSIKPGEMDDRVPLLRQRLGQPELESAPTLYDDSLVEAIRTFQASLGLTADGIVGNATRDAINRAAGITREQILVNLEKWRWLPRDRGDYRVEVNIPEYRLWVRSKDQIVHEARVVVGTRSNQTPVFYDEIRHVVVNPFWNVPASIALGEIAPQVKQDPGYLQRRGFELLRGGRVLDPWSVDWASLGQSSFPYSVRQKPGTNNALGQVKFLFPNKHDVYLHDTPEKSLFARDVRAFSHGCVRVQNPFDFADALLANEPSFSADDLVDSLGPKERWFNMEPKVPVYLTYFTLKVDDDGNVRSFADIYGHDQKIAAALVGARPDPINTGSPVRQ